MLKKLLVKLTLSFFLISSLSPVHCGGVRHNPRHIFFNPSSDQPATFAHRATKADILHGNNIRGKGIKIAVIDINFHPNDIDFLNKKACLLPSVIQKKLVLTPDENLNQLNLAQLKANQVAFNTIPDYKELVLRKEYFDEAFAADISGHGSRVMRTLHSMAPEVQLLPIDLNCTLIRAWDKVFPEAISDSEQATCFASAIYEAIHNQVDAISLSLWVVDDKNGEVIHALREAAQKGIAIISAAGNDSTRQQATYLDTGKYPNGGRFKKSTRQAFEDLKGQGMLFAGSLEYSKAGGESFSDFSAHPPQDTLMHYLLAPGEHVYIETNNEAVWASGTSLSAPAVAAGYGLLKQYSKAKGLILSREELLRILHHSGHDLIHSIPGTPFKTYKVLNLENAKVYIDALANPPAPKTVKPTRANQKAAVAKRMAHHKAQRQATIRKGRATVRKAPQRKVQRQAIVRKGRATVGKAPQRRVQRPATVRKGRATVRKAPQRRVQRQAIVRKERAAQARKRRIRS